MKSKAFLLIGAGMIVFSGFTPVLAQTTISIGGHYWYAGLDYSPVGFENVEVDPAHMYGPYINVSLNKFFIGSSIFFGTFSMDFGSGIVFYDRWGGYFEYTGNSLVLDNKRMDLNFSAGYRILPRLSIFAAVKKLSYKVDKNVEVLGIDYYDGNYSVETSGMLFGGGVSGVISAPRMPFFLFYSGTYLAGTMNNEWSFDVEGQNQNGDEWEFDSNITAITLGVGHRMDSGLTIMVGYRADFSGEDEGEEKIHGIMATISYPISQ